MYLYIVSTFFGFTILLDSNVNNIFFSKLSFHKKWLTVMGTILKMVTRYNENQVLPHSKLCSFFI